MKTERIEELFKYNSGENDYRNPTMDIDNFTNAINQAELEWYKKLEKKLQSALCEYSVVATVFEYIKDIQEKIKELENDR